MNCQTALICGFVGWVSVTASLGQQRRTTRAPEQIRPNIILIMTDDQGYGDLACHGNPWLKTPNIDKLHAQSVRLTNYHTGTTCSPTRASLMTGQYGNRVGVWHTIAGRSLLRPGVPTLAGMLQKNGYRTAIFGKWHLGDTYPLRPQDRGFQEVLIHGGGGVGQTPDHWNNDYFDDTYQRNGQPKTYQGYCTDVWFTEALRFVETNRNRPFFCYLTPNAPHAPYHVPESYRKAYADNPDIPNPNFYGMITNLDENVGRLMQRLQALGLDKNTILIFTTDNGSAAGATLNKARGQVAKGYNAGMRGMKASPYEGGHRVPFFIRYPAGQVSGGRDVPQLTSCLDVLPTLLGLSKASAPAKNFRATPGRATPGLDGADLTPLLRENRNRAAWPARTLVVDTQREDTLKKNKPSAVMTDRWRLINGRELYDLPNDPGQWRDVATQYPDTVQKLQRVYEKWWADISQRRDEYVRIDLGGAENPVQLTCHDLHPDGNGKLNPAWSQEAVRMGSPALTGTWAVDVQKPGHYTVSLRRWPQESGLNNSDVAPAGTPVSGGPPYPVGKVFPWRQAYLKIGDSPVQTTALAGESAPVFTVSLPRGPAMLRAWFTDAAGAEVSAFYVVVKNEILSPPTR